VVWLILLATFLIRNRKEIPKLIAKVRLSHFLASVLVLSIGANAWLFYHAPIVARQSVTEIPQPQPQPAVELSDSEKKDRVALLDRLMVQLNTMKASGVRARDISENWQYQVQTDPNNFIILLTQVANGFYTADTELKSLERLFAGRKDIADLFNSDYPDCNGKSNALHSEIFRINTHKGAELLFTLLNDTKLAEFRAAAPECEKWAGARAG
jgi:hypothetical protein